MGILLVWRNTDVSAWWVNLDTGSAQVLVKPTFVPELRGKRFVSFHENAKGHFVALLVDEQVKPAGQKYYVATLPVTRQREGKALPSASIGKMAVVEVGVLAGKARHVTTNLSESEAVFTVRLPSTRTADGMVYRFATMGVGFKPIMHEIPVTAVVPEGDLVSLSTRPVEGQGGRWTLIDGVNEKDGRLAAVIMTTVAVPPVPAK